MERPASSPQVRAADDANPQPPGTVRVSPLASRLATLRAAVAPAQTSELAAALVASGGASWSEHCASREVQLVALHDWLTSGDARLATSDALRHGSRMLHLLADHPEAPWIAAGAIAARGDAAWGGVFAEVFGARGVAAAAQVLEQGVSPALAGELLALVGLLGESALVTTTAWSWLGSEDAAARRRCLAMLHDRWTPEALLVALESATPSRRLGAAELAETLPPDDGLAPALEAALRVEPSEPVRRVLRRALAIRRLHALRGERATRPPGATLDALLGALAPPESAMFAGPITTAKLRWHDETPLGAGAGRLLLDALSDETAEHEVPLVTAVRELLEPASCHAFADALAHVPARAGGVGRWAPWAHARFCPGPRIVRLATELHREGSTAATARARALLRRNGSADALALLESWSGDPWSYLAATPGGGTPAPAGALDALLDRGVAHRGLDAQRRRAFGYGRHALLIELGHDGRTLLRRAVDGARIERLPEPAPSEDHLALRARRRWLREYRAELEASYERAVLRLAEPGREWRGAAFRRDVLGHPVMVCAAHRYARCIAMPTTAPGKVATTFHLVEGRPIDPRGLRLEIPDDARVWRSELRAP